MNEKAVRTFLAIPVPDSVASKKNMLYSTLEDSPAYIHWVKNSQLHLTVKYFGNTPESSFDKIINQVKTVTEKFSPFNLVIEDTGCIPVVERPRVLYMGVKGNKASLEDLVSKIEERMNSLGFPRNEKKYFPHVTVAKIKYPQKHTPNIKIFMRSSYDSIEFTVNRLQLFSSELLPSGTIYTLLQTFPLGEKF